MSGGARVWVNIEGCVVSFGGGLAVRGCEGASRVSKLLLASGVNYAGSQGMTSYVINYNTSLEKLWRGPEAHFVLSCSHCTNRLHTTQSIAPVWKRL